MEQESKLTWESPVESAEQMLSEHTAQNEWFAGIRKQLAESRVVMREMIGRDVIKKTGRFIAEKWDEFETELNDTICDADAEEEADE